MASKNYFENIAFVGAGGQQGKWITEALLKQGKHKITAITREDSTSTFPSGVHIAKVNYDDHNSIVNALKGQDVLIITIAVTAPRDLQNRLIDAAVDAGVKWILPNLWGHDGPTKQVDEEALVAPMKYPLRAYLESKKVSWSGFSCGFWYEFSLAGSQDRYGFDFQKKSLLLLDEGETKMPTSTWPFVGLAVAKLLALPVKSADGSLSLEDFRNRMVKIASFNVSQKEMFESVLRVTGDKESDWKVTKTPVKPYYEEAVKLLKETGDRRYWGRALYTRYFFPDANWVDQFGTDNERLGLPKENIDDFTKIALKMDEEGYFQ